MSMKLVIFSLVLARTIQADPLTPDYLGTPRYIQIDSWSKTVLNGGEFNGKVSTLTSAQLQAGSNTPANPFTPPNGYVQTVFWCVDSQLYFNFGNSGFANIMSMSSLPTSSIRYGTIDDDNVPADGDPGWTNTGVGASTLSDAARDRFLMAAFLVNSYSFVKGASNNNNEAIQRAIWAIMNNSTMPHDTPGYTGDSNADRIIDGNVNTDGSVAYWVDKAIDSLSQNAVDPTKWAVVSWVANQNGTLPANGGSQSPDFRQTFLVQVVPEPGFYGLLAGGLSLIVWTFRRRSIAS